MKEFTGLLNFLGWQPNEYMQYGFRYQSDKIIWCRSRVPEALSRVESVLASKRDCDAWFGVNPVSKGTGRAKSSEVTRVVSAYLDLDFKESGLRSEQNAMVLLQEIIEVVEAPTHALVHTGGGVQAYFPLSDEEANDVVGARLTLKRLQLFAESIAHRHDLGKLDNVSDLTRVLRIPGSKNLKYAHKPEVFRVYGVIASEQEASVRWVTKEDLSLLTLDPKRSGT